jgi:hypothetical protein
MTRLCTMAALTFEELISEIHHLFAPICEAHPEVRPGDVQMSDRFRFRFPKLTFLPFFLPFITTALLRLAEPSHIPVLLVISLGLLRP